MPKSFRQGLGRILGCRGPQSWVRRLLLPSHVHEGRGTNENTVWLFSRLVPENLDVATTSAGSMRTQPEYASVTLGVYRVHLLLANGSLRPIKA